MFPILEVFKLDAPYPPCEFCTNGTASVFVPSAMCFMCTPCLEALTATLHCVDSAANAENN